MAKKIKARPVTMTQVREYLAKAEEFPSPPPASRYTPESPPQTPFAAPASRRELQGRSPGDDQPARSGRR